LDFDESVTLS